MGLLETLISKAYDYLGHTRSRYRAACTTDVHLRDGLIESDDYLPLMEPEFVIGSP